MSDQFKTLEAWPQMTPEQGRILDEMLQHLLKFMSKGMMGRLGTFGEVRTLFSALVLRSVIHRNTSPGNTKDSFRRLLDAALDEEWDHWESVLKKEGS